MKETDLELGVHVADVHVDKDHAYFGTITNRRLRVTGRLGVLAGEVQVQIVNRNFEQHWIDIHDLRVMERTEFEKLSKLHVAGFYEHIKAVKTWANPFLPSMWALPETVFDASEWVKVGAGEHIITASAAKSAHGYTISDLEKLRKKRYDDLLRESDLTYTAHRWMPGDPDAERDSKASERSSLAFRRERFEIF